MKAPVLRKLLNSLEANAIQDETRKLVMASKRELDKLLEEQNQSLDDSCAFFSMETGALRGGDARQKIDEIYKTATPIK